jgi:hypothetical protein
MGKKKTTTIRINPKTVREWAKYNLYGVLGGAAETKHMEPYVEELIKAIASMPLPPPEPIYTFPDVSNI